jgi:hypothetical protein
VKTNLRRHAQVSMHVPVTASHVVVLKTQHAEHGLGAHEFKIDVPVVQHVGTRSHTGPMEHIRCRDHHFSHERGSWGELGAVPYSSAGRCAHRHSESIEAAITSVSLGAYVGPKGGPMEVDEALRRVRAPVQPWNDSHWGSRSIKHLNQSEDRVVVDRVNGAHRFRHRYTSGGGRC